MTTENAPDKAALDPRAITRPDNGLLTYYILVSAAALLAFPFVFIPLYIRFRTLRYAFDGEGVSMSWGLLFHHEVYLTYRRIQDIHVSRNIIERWMGLAKVPIQTASGSSGATMLIVGIRDPEPLRDFLYTRMRGAQEKAEEEEKAPSGEAEALSLLSEIRDELRQLRQRREAQS
ncbi:MAG: PH domain-containing protein [Candidatus Latescibacteria bacterium]|nr:PH domain-containing protein [Candidatus Latescibacterota bacterium]